MHGVVLEARNQKVADALRARQGHKVHELALSVVTRWNSKLEEIRSFLHPDVLPHLVAIYGSFDPPSATFPTPHQQRLLRGMCLALEPLEFFTKLVSRRTAMLGQVSTLF